jgi:hypothetical protein
MAQAVSHHGFLPTPVHAGFVVDKVALGPGSLVLPREYQLYTESVLYMFPNILLASSLNAAEIAHPV